MTRKLLILDLDETLIHGVESPLDAPHDFKAGPYFVYKRPGLQEFLQTMNDHFDLAVWTSSTRSYAEVVVGNIFPAEISLQFVWARDRCTWRLDPEFLDYEWTKNLCKVKRKGFSLEQVLIVDDTPAKLARSYGNLVRIRPFEGDQCDTELFDLSRYLPQLVSAPNVRAIEKRDWRQKLGHNLTS